MLLVGGQTFISLDTSELVCVLAEVGAVWLKTGAPPTEGCKVPPSDGLTNRLSSNHTGHFRGGGGGGGGWRGVWVMMADRESVKEMNLVKQGKNKKKVTSQLKSGPRLHDLKMGMRRERNPFSSPV